MLNWKWRIVARMLVWGILLCALWTAGIFATCYGVLGVVHAFHPDYFVDGDFLPPYDAFVTIAFWASFVFTFYLSPRGFLVGALCGFYAPASGVVVRRAPFLWRVVRFVLLAGVAVCLVAAGCGWIFARYLSPLLGLGVFLILELIGFGLTLWHTLNGAIASFKKIS